MADCCVCVVVCWLDRASLAAASGRAPPSQSPSTPSSTTGRSLPSGEHIIYIAFSLPLIPLSLPKLIVVDFHGTKPKDPSFLPFAFNNPASSSF